MNTIPPEFRSYSLEEVAALMEGGGRRISVRTLQEYCRKGVLRGVKIGAQWRVSHLNLSAWLNGDVPAAGPASPVDETVRDRPVAAASPTDAPSKDATLPDSSSSAPDEAKLPPAPAPRRPAATRTLADLVEEQLAAGPGPASTPDEVEPPTIPPEPESVEGGSDPVDPAPPVSGAPQAGEALDDDRGADVATVRQEFYPSGRLKLRYRVRAGSDGRWVRDGLFEAFHESGEAAARGHYRDGRLDGPWEQWHPNGRPKSSGRHAAGLKEGVWVWWDEEGRKTQEGGFRAGRPHGAWVQWHPNGKVWCRGGYESGEPRGKWEWFDVEGRAF